MKHVIQSFSRGVHNKVHPMYLRPDEAVDVLNIDISKGILECSKAINWSNVDVHNPVTLVDKDGNDLTISSSTHNMVKQLHSRVYTTDIGSDTPLKVTYNGETHNIPLEKLVDNNSISIFKTYEAIAALDNFKGFTTDFKQDNITLAITNYCTKTGYESAPIFKTIDTQPFIDLPHKDYDGTDVASSVYEVNNLSHITDSDMRHYLETGKVRLKRVRSEHEVTGGSDLTYSDQVDVMIQYWMQDDIEKFNLMWTDVYIATKSSLYSLVVEIARKATSRNMTPDYRKRLYEWLFEKKIGICDRYMYEYEYQPDIVSIEVRYLRSYKENYEYRVYIKGKFTEAIQSSEYQLVDGKPYATDDTNLSIPILIKDNIIGTACATERQIDKLDCSMFAVSTTNIWLVEKDTNRVWYTIPGSLDIINSVAYVSLPTIVTGVHYINNTLVVFCADNSIHSITGMDKSNLTLKRISDDIDCIHVNTISRVTQTLVWLSSKGLCATNGFSVQLLNRDTVRPDTFNTDTAIISSSSTDDYYYLLLGTIIWEYNIRTRVLVKHDSTLAKKLWLYKGEVYAHNGASLSGKLFSAAENPLYYKTGNVVKPDYTTHKEFQYFRVAYIGTPVIKVFMDNVQVNEVTLPTSDVITHEAFQVQEGVTGYAAHLEITGICSIYNIEVNYNIREEK